MNWLQKMFSTMTASNTNTEEKVSFGPCIFCGEQVAEAGPDPVWLEAKPKNGKGVIWFCHARCLADRISPKMPEGFVEPERSAWRGLTHQSRADGPRA